ncbi:MAG: hypothetical protein A2Y95_07305 [Deltaproteobacteria bacterium RBG_13_65_10]|nr:MAG: hypothetical protein A2Y95_07305 [Deltaproteobacteria bacterium RBG_13_65_10]
MKKVRRILVPVDFSPTSAAAIRTALRIASQSRAGVTLLHVYPFPRGALGAYRTLKRIEADARGKPGDWVEDSRRTLSAWAARYGKGKIRIAKVFAIGRPGREINIVARQVGADLIVMGTRGLGGLKGAVLGSTTAETLRAADIPVLAVHAGRGASFDPTRVLVADDFGPGGRSAIAAAGDFAKPQGASILLLHVVDLAPILYAGIVEGGLSAPPNYLAEDEKRALAILDRRARTLRRRGFKVECLVVSGTPAVYIARIAGRWRARLVVAATHGRRGITRFVLGNTAEALLRGVRCPILVVPSQAVPRRKR